MRYGHGTCTTYCAALVNVAKSFSALEHKRTWQGTVPETSAKVYGAWRIPAYSGMY